ITERGGSGRPHDAVIPLEGVFVPTSVALPGHLATVVNVQPECPGVPRQHAEIRDLPPAPAHRVDCAAHRAAGTDHPAAVADGAGPARVAALQSAEVRDDPRLPEHGVDSRARLQIADDLAPIVQGARVEAQRNDRPVVPQNPFAVTPPENLTRFVDASGRAVSATERGELLHHTVLPQERALWIPGISRRRAAGADHLASIVDVRCGGKHPAQRAEIPYCSVLP